MSKKHLHRTMERSFSFLGPNFAILNLGFTPNDCVKERHPCFMLWIWCGYWYMLCGLY